MHIIVQMTINIVLVWGFVMHISVRMTIHIVPLFFPMRFCEKGIVSSSVFLALMCRFHRVRNAIQRVNSVLQLTHYNCF